MQHEELLKILLPLIDFINENGFNYFIVVGKNDTCARYAKGNPAEISAMLCGLMDKNKEIRQVVENAATAFLTT